jgi:hypothetical protein
MLALDLGHADDRDSLTRVASYHVLGGFVFTLGQREGKHFPALMRIRPDKYEIHSPLPSHTPSLQYMHSGDKE